MGLVDAIKGAFSFLGSRSQSEERMAQYVIREHHRGRPLARDPRGPLRDEPPHAEQVRRLLDRPDVIHAVGKDTIAAMG